MELWFTENHTGNTRFSIKLKQQICSLKSEFQEINIFESYEFGKILVLDGYLMLTERDEFIYHEMMTHIPLAVKECENVLIIGGGDGGAVLQLIKYPNIKNIDVVEIDEMVVDSCVKHFPGLTAGFSDTRVKIHYEDGMKFIRKKHDEYDLIIVDSTDPFGPGEALFTREFYGNCEKALTKDGVMVNQHESVFYEEYVHVVKKARAVLSELFSISMIYQAHIPTYPSGHWLFGFSSKNLHPIRNLKCEKWRDKDIDTKYYNTDIHSGSFFLPTYVRNIVC